MNHFAADAPILMIDSGFGGLTIYDAVRARLPEAPIIYAADLAGLPYGTKSEAEVAARVCGLLGRMSERYAPRLAVIACNTASTIALSMVRDVLEIPIVGTVPAIKPAAAATRTGVIGVLGTAATIRQPYVDDLETQFAAGKTLVRHAAPELVLLAEAKLRGEEVRTDAVAAAVDGLLENVGGRMDTVVLACTHFPLLGEELHSVFGPDVALIDGAPGIARRVEYLLTDQSVANGPSSVVATGPSDKLNAYAPALQKRGFTTIASF